MPKMLITGGCGFIGSNATVYFARRGWSIIVLDNLSRPGAANNAEWIRAIPNVECIEGDIRDPRMLDQVIGRHRDVNAVLHLAAQVAVTTSVADPVTDCEINVMGTLKLLEAIRRQGADPVFIYASTNKVYGDLRKLATHDHGQRYALVDCPRGVTEEFPVDFYSPYGCSKGGAEMYVLDYARVYGLRTVSLRQSCIYGPHQHGVEDQGWVAWFIICAMVGRPVTIFGDGKQVRDILFVDDLVDCYERCIADIECLKGCAFNVGGGPESSLSLLEFIETLKTQFGLEVQYSFAEARPGDQRVYVSDIDRITDILGWKPRTAVKDGMKALVQWVADHKDRFVTSRS